ncbi:hypothetical protein [Fredinandcohnia onubensis]|nr:hypothetical protein [Fredinandcohnia onubensis]
MKNQMRLGVFAPRFFSSVLEKFHLKNLRHAPEAIILFSGV